MKKFRHISACTVLNFRRFNSWSTQQCHWFDLYIDVLARLKWCSSQTYHIQSFHLDIAIEISISCMQPNCPSCFIFITLRKNNYAEFAKECSQDMIWNGCKANSAIKQFVWKRLRCSSDSGKKKFNRNRILEMERLWLWLW